MGEPLISVILPVRNGERFLAFAIESILAQTYQPLETLVIDGGSTDRTPDIARSFEAVRYMRQIAPGIGAAYNEGIALAQGEFIGFMAYDDLWTPDKLRIQIDYLNQHLEVQCVFSRVKFFLEPGSRLPPGFRSELLSLDHIGRIPETLLARRTVFDQIGGFDTSLSVAADVDWCTRVSDAGLPIAVLPKVLLLKRVHELNNTSMDIPCNNQDLLRIFKQSVDRKRAQGDKGKQGETHDH
jgi:glycosyltransferase involved in cell wall biosynthesis